MAEIRRAKDAFSLDLPSGAPLNVRQGDLFMSDDPIMKGREHLFEEIKVKSSEHPEEYLSARLARTSPRRGQEETATADPGERRRVVPRPGGSSGGSGSSGAKSGDKG